MFRSNISDKRDLWDRRKNLQGTILKIGWTAGQPWIYQVNSTKTSKIEIAGVNYDLAKSLAWICNFTVELEKVDGYGVLQLDGTWTGIVEKLRTRQVDMAISGISITFEREDVIDFSVGLHSEEYVLFMKSSDQALHWGTFSDVFTDGFWSCLITFIITLSLSLCIVQVHELGIIFKNFDET